MFVSIGLFAWSKISTKLFVQDLFCWLLTCVYHIYYISVHWSWKLSLGVFENCQWDVSKLYIWILCSCRFVEACGKGAGFCDFICCHQYIDWIQGSSSSYSIFQLCGQVLDQDAKSPIGLISCNVLVFHLKFVGENLMLVKYYVFIVGQRFTKACWLNPLPIFKHNYVKFLKKYLYIKDVF